MLFVDRRKMLAVLAGLMTVLVLAAPQAVQAQVTAFRQAVAEAAARDDDLAAFYRARDFQAIWAGDSEIIRARRNALLTAFSHAVEHGLPAGRYDPAMVIAELRAATTPAQQGAMEVELSRLFLQYARDVQTGILVPKTVDAGIVRDVQYRPRLDTITNFIAANPATFIRALPPTNPEYSRLMAEKIRLERLIVEGGWGPQVSARSLQPGADGPAVIEMRNRLIAMGVMPRSVAGTYDATLQAAVTRFQAMHGLEQDGVAGETTVAEINVPVESRLQSILVAMERERWMNMPRGDRHIWVNLTDFTANIVDHGRVTFSTRSVVGANQSDRRTPEFSDQMEFMVINPSWYVPRSIVTKEYLPMMQRNSGAAGQLTITDRNGRAVNRSAINFGAYNASNFPFAMRQAPGSGNALGQVKFMFPNPYNIYLHDTPSRSLFANPVRAYSHGCIRLNDPKDFAYALLALQTDDPEGLFQSHLRTGAESRVNLETPVPVHIDYRTAFTNIDGSLQFRRDVYGRDAKIWDALAREGVAVRAVQG